MTSARFLWSGLSTAVLLGTLPAALVLRNGPRQHVIQWGLTQLVEEVRAPRPDSALSVPH